MRRKPYFDKLGWEIRHFFIPDFEGEFEKKEPVDGHYFPKF